jgi:glycosyltransferase involved in cell wall biosynthesis
MKPGISSYTFIHNAITYDYPILESVESILPAVDQHILCECDSDDGTIELCQKLADKYSKIKLIHMPWGTHYTIQSNLANYCMKKADFEWTLKLDADEVLHDDSIEDVKSITLLKDFNLATMHYTHFMANYETEFDFCYRRVPRIARQGKGWTWDGDACQLINGEGPVFDSNIEIFHYGKVHEGKVGFKKEWDFQHMYTDLGFPDKRMLEMKEKLGEEYCDYLYLFEETIKAGNKVRHFTGTHPTVMKERIANFKEGGWEQFMSKMKEGLKV